jgi:SAM-dependent methyltransferase
MMAEVEMVVHDPQGVALGTHPNYPVFKHVVPLPSISLMDSIGAATLENFFIVAEAWAAVVSRFVPAGGRILDIGCGCGRTARLLALRPDVTYLGFDVFKPSIEWAEAFITPLTEGRFRFAHVDGHSAHYNPRGTLKPGEVRFPGEDRGFDVAFAASLFTHLLEADAGHYLAESARCLRPGGVLVASIHDEPPAGVRYSGREDRIDVDRGYFVDMAGRAGFAVREDLGALCGQTAVAFERR